MGRPVTPWIVGLALLLGCGFEPRGADGVDAADDQDDGGGSDVGDGDLDDDGVPDSTDNCPRLANPPPQRDHDGDGAGDPCDPCPHRPLADGGGDADGDGVGDPCDPRPGARDRIQIFDGFYELPDDLTTAGTWDHDPAGYLRHAAAVTAAEVALLPRSLDPPYQVETLVVVDTVSGDPSLVARHAGVVFAADGALDGFYMCSVRDDFGAGTPARAVIARFTMIDQTAENTSTNLVGDLATGSRFRVRGGAAASEQTCLGTLDATSGSPTLVSSVLPGKRVGVRTFGLAVRFDYLVIYQPAP